MVNRMLQTLPPHDEAECVNAMCREHYPNLDAKGRMTPGTMSDRELMEEILANQRATQDLVLSFIEGMKNNPMMKMMAGKFGG